MKKEKKEKSTGEDGTQYSKQIFKKKNLRFDDRQKEKRRGYDFDVELYNSVEVKTSKSPNVISHFPGNEFTADLNLIAKTLMIQYIDEVNHKLYVKFVPADKIDKSKLHHKIEMKLAYQKALWTNPDFPLETYDIKDGKII